MKHTSCYISYYLPVSLKNNAEQHPPSPGGIVKTEVALPLFTVLFSSLSLSSLLLLLPGQADPVFYPRKNNHNSNQEQVPMEFREKHKEGFFSSVFTQLPVV